MKKLFFTTLLFTILLTGCFQEPSTKSEQEITHPKTETPVKQEKSTDDVKIEESDETMDDTAEMELKKEIKKIDDDFVEMDPVIETAENDVDAYKDAPTIILKDVTGGDASGEAWIIVKDNKTFHKVVGKNLPELQNDDFYEGWLVKTSPKLDFFSTGKMHFDNDGDAWFLDYEVDGDKSDYPKAVITLEPDDGDPAPAKHIIEN